MDIDRVMENLDRTDRVVDFNYLFTYIDDNIFTGSVSNEKRLLLLITATDIPSDTSLSAIMKSLKQKNVNLAVLNIGDVDTDGLTDLEPSSVVTVKDVDELPDVIGILEENVGIVFCKLLLLRVWNFSFSSFAILIKPQGT